MYAARQFGKGPVHVVPTGFDMSLCLLATDDLVQVPDDEDLTMSLRKSKGVCATCRKRALEQSEFLRVRLLMFARAGNRFMS